MNNPDWPRIVIDLSRTLGNITALSKRTGIPLSSLSALICERQTEPRYARGHMLIQLHEKLCGN